MRQITQAWVQFKGVKNTDFIGLRMLDMPQRPRPQANGVAHEIPGRSGDLWEFDGSFGIISIPVRLVADGDYSIDEIIQWLSGSGELVFSDEPNRAYRARVEKSYIRSPFVHNMDAQIFTVDFTCQPFRYLYPAANAVSIDASGQSLSNPGNTTSAPKITINGSGSFVLTIGSQIVRLADVPEGGIVLDTEIGDAFTPDMAGLLNNCVDGDFPVLNPGLNAISWVIEIGAINSISIEPRWRFI